MPLVFVKFFEHAVERTEEEIKELLDLGLVRDEQPPAPRKDAVKADKEQQAS